MSKYTVIAGDTFETISRKVYGSERKQSLIIVANPGIFPPLRPGTILNIPKDPSAPKNLAAIDDANRPEETVIKINQERFRFWTDVTVKRSMDSIDEVTFSAPFTPEDSSFRNAIRPFSFSDVEIEIGGERYFTGTLVSVNPKVDDASRTITIGCYAEAGIMNDCTPPASALPTEYYKQSLSEIAKTITGYFGLSATFEADPGAIFETVGLTPGDKCLDFLIKLAKQRNLVISTDADGNLVFSKEIETGIPVANLSTGVSPVISVEPTFSPQNYFSHLTGIEPAVVGLPGGSFTVINPRLQGKTRPVTFEIPDTETADVKTAVQAKAGRMFGSMVTYRVPVSTWLDPLGNIWRPNTFVNLLAPDAMIYSNYKFLLKSVELSESDDSQTAVLELALPGSYSGQIPEAFPWDE